MSLYLIGDLQGCSDALDRLLERIAFTPSRDTLFVLGDLVNRGPDSLGVLRRLMRLGTAARCLLGNHDLHLLALAHGIRQPGRGDTLSAVLDAPDRAGLLEWLLGQRLAMLEQIGGRPLLMVHAGLLPSWSAERTVELAAEVEALLRGDGIAGFLAQMYGNDPLHWSEDLRGPARWRAIVNVLTRLRFCSADDGMEFETKEGAASAPPGFAPWFDFAQRRSAGVTVAFGHWSTLGWLNRPDVYGMDTGCVWGGALSALRVAADRSGPYLGGELIQIPCVQARRPGA
ncbi:MAG: symmetrical bis(5'-nucleosyl)-tetraphosphatase [Burkholderiaceae bacterium]